MHLKADGAEIKSEHSSSYLFDSLFIIAFILITSSLVFAELKKEGSDIKNQRNSIRCMPSYRARGKSILYHSIGWTIFLIVTSIVSNSNWIKFTLFISALIILSNQYYRFLLSLRNDLKIEMNNREKERKFRELISVIMNHLPALSIKKKQCSRFDEYGICHTTGWDKEIKYFNDVVIPSTINVGPAYFDSFDIGTIIDCVIKLNPTRDKLIKFSDSMEPLEYEKLCTEILTEIGWSAYTTKASGDQGADVIAELHGVRIVLQCKLYAKPVGNSAVQEVSAARAHYGAHFAAVVSNSSFTSGAKGLAATNRVALLHHDQLQGWVSQICTP